MRFKGVAVTREQRELGHGFVQNADAQTFTLLLASLLQRSLQATDAFCEATVVGFSQRERNLKVDRLEWLERQRSESNAPRRDSKLYVTLRSCLLNDDDHISGR